ncbi:hypothetical protein NSS79_02815 [Paenibacillus sp. FSL L8-0436]|uniref:hypothetical protein n=1 Tax=Paenibacillus sp. FSL L8-0436 TaxID=2954686 RepID=UPI00315820FF
MTNNNFKVFKLEEKIDFIIYLRFLIISTHKQMKRYKSYLKNLEYLVKNLDLHNENVTSISGDIYDDFSDRLGKLHIDLLNTFADESNSAASYKKCRKLMERKKDQLGIDELSEEIKEILAQLNNNRNWSSHIPESLIHAQFEAADKYGFESGKEDIINKPNPITIFMYSSYEKGWILSLIDEAFRLHKAYSKIFQQMKKDYSRLVGQSVEIITEYQISDRPFEEDFAVPVISMQMQTKKYGKV